MKTDHFAKLVVLFVLGILSTVIVLSGGTVVRTASAFSGGPPAGHTGAPGESLCTECHIGIANSGPGEFQLIGPGLYEPGKTYQITIKHVTTDSSRRQWGFQLTALDTNNHRAGELKNPNGLTQVDNTTVSRQYIEHTFAGTFQGQTLGATWTVDWVAPDEDIGPVALYAAGNQANGNGLNTGDQIYTTRGFIFSGPPEITGAAVNKKKLIVMGRNFDIGAQMRLDGAKVKKVSNDDETPTEKLTAKKAGKTIAHGQTVELVVKNPDGTASEPFEFTRP